MSNHILQPIPYLFFNGQCLEALSFYGDILGGKVVSKMTYGEMPGDMPCPEEAKNRIMNAMLELPGGMMIYGSDSFPGRDASPVSGFMVTLNFPTAEEAELVFNKLSAGGEISMPFSPSFWAEKFGMLTDRYGIEWAVNGNLPAPK